jgi:hypothetical protein
MYTVNVVFVKGLQVKVASGNPSLFQPEGARYVTFESPEYFVLHMVGKGGSLLGILTPGGGPEN